jgi:hypothetical protein
MKFILFLASLLLAGCASTHNQSIRVSGIGSNFENARHDAFTKAIEYKMGTLVLSERETHNFKLVKNDISVFSSGYIDKYNIVSETTNGKLVSVTVDVTVSDSKIKDRLLGSGTNLKELEGYRHSVQHSSYIRDRLQGDKILNTVLNDYPTKAYSIRQGMHEVRLDAYRNMLLRIPYSMNWNYNYIVSLNEVLSLLQDGSNGFMQPSSGTVTVMAKDPNNLLIGKKEVYKFNDIMRVHKINDSFTGHNEARIQLSIKNKQLVEVYRTCYESNSINGKKPSYYVLGNNFVLYGNQQDQGLITLPISPNSALSAVLKDAYRVELSIVKLEKCSTRH